MTSYSAPGALPAPITEFDAGELLGGLASLLWRERELLEALLYKLTVHRVLLEAGDIADGDVDAERWLDRSVASVWAAALSVQDHEVNRAIETDALVRGLGLPADASLARLAAAVPVPWPDMLADHRDALRALVAEIDEVVDGMPDVLPIEWTSQLSLVEFVR